MTVRTARSAAPTEAQEQKALFEWADRAKGKYPELRWLFHIPNGGTRNLIEARHLKEQGVKAGVPDIFLPCPNPIHMGLFIEMKRQKGGRISEEQSRWIAELNKSGYRAVVAYGFEDAKQIILNYLRK